MIDVPFTVFYCNQRGMERKHWTRMQQVHPGENFGISAGIGDVKPR